MSEWVETTLGEVAEVVRGVTYKPSDVAATAGPDVVAVLRATNFDESGINDDNLVYVAAARVESQQRLRRNDVLVTMSTGSLRAIGKSCVIHRDYDSAFGGFLAVIRAKANFGGATFLDLVLTSGEVRNYWRASARGTSIRNLSVKAMGELPISLPPLVEQLRIAAAMSALDVQVEALEVEARVMSATLALLRNELPVADCVPLGDVLVSIDSGKSVQTDGEAPKIGLPRILKVSALRPGLFRPEEAKSLDVEMPTVSLVNEGDLLMTRSNTPDRVGHCARARLVPAETYMPDLIWRLRIDGTLVDADYLEQALASPEMRARITATATGTSASMRKINKRGVATVLIPLPTMKVQREFAKSRRSMSIARDALAAEIAQLRTVRANLFSALLSQEITVDAAVDKYVKGA